MRGRNLRFTGDLCAEVALVADSIGLSQRLPMTLSLPQKLRRCPRRGYTLLDTLAAGVVLAIVLTPAYEAMQRGLAWSRDAENQQTTTTLCVGKMEEHMAIVASSFAAGTSTGDFSSDGFSQFRYSVVCSDAAVDGGIEDRLMAISVTVWQDSDADGVLDTGEIRTVLTTKIAQMTTYASS